MTEWTRPALAIDTCDRKATAEALTQAYLFVSAVNAESAFEAFSEDRPAPQTEVVVRVRNAIAARENQWSNRSEVVGCFERAFDAPIDALSDVVDCVAELMIRPHTIDPDTRATPNWQITRSQFRALDLPRQEGSSVPAELTPLAIPSTSESVPLVSRADARLTAIEFWDPVFDPISILEGFCITALGTREEAVDHYLQRWIKETFDLRLGFDRDLPLEPRHISDRDRLQIVCKRFNKLFFDAEFPSRDQVQATRTRTVEFRALLDHLETIFTDGITPSSVVRRKALGAYVLLRFNRSLRTRYARSESPRHALVARLCLTGARALEFTHLQIRAFGGLTGIQGLNYIFRGGLMPRSYRGHSLVLRGPAGAGKTALATNLLADIASRGRFAAYLALEEDPEAILGRLETFNLCDRRLFDVLVYPQERHRIRAAHEAGRGAFAIVAIQRGKELEVLDVVRKIAAELSDLQGFGWKALAIDSIDVLRFEYEAQVGEPTRATSRNELRTLFRALETENFLGLFVTENGGSCDRYAAFLADTDIEIGRDVRPAGRWVRVHKSRLQPAHDGNHLLRIREGRGVRIYPTLSAVQSSIRRRVKPTLSHDRTIPVPREYVLMRGIREKSSTLIYGQGATEKTELLLHLATAPSVDVPGRGTSPPLGTVIVTFRTSDLQFKERVQYYEPWHRIPAASVRWYSPGESLRPAHIVDELRERIRRGRREGIRIERVAFDEIEAVEQCLPAVATETMFWPMIIQLLATESITTTFVCGTSDEHDPTLRVLKLSCDYVLRAVTRPYVIEKQPQAIGAHYAAS